MEKNAPELRNKARNITVSSFKVIATVLISLPKGYLML